MFCDKKLSAVNAKEDHTVHRRAIWNRATVPRGGFGYKVRWYKR
jgi:hypothetical protein